MLFRSRREKSDAAEVVGQTFVAAQDSCNYCHGTKYDTVLNTWKGMIDAQLAKAQKEYDLANDTVTASSASAVDKLRAQRLLDDAIHNIRLVKLGHGVHNVNYATAALSVAIENCKEARRAVGAWVTAATGAGP